MLMLPRIAFVVLLVVVGALIVGTSGGLPEQVATHFGSSGAANGFMSHNGYIVFMLAFSVVMPLVVVATTGLVPRIARSGRNVPHFDYWFAPARREASSARLLSHACLLGCWMLLFFGALHGLLLDANTTVPARLHETVFFALLAVFVVGLGVWMLVMRRMFARPA